MNELRYLNLVNKILDYGNITTGRNGNTNSLPFQILDLDISDGTLPLVTTRQIFTKGILGEYAAIIRSPNNLNDFKKWDCNYWDKFAGPNGELNIDYGKGFEEQGSYIIDALKSNKSDRRMLINFWDFRTLASLSLPCCFYSMQFYKANGQLDMLWNQRSCDVALGLPSDMLFAALMLINFADLSSLKVGKIKMVLGDAHIYAAHFNTAKEQLQRTILEAPRYYFKGQTTVTSFEPSDLTILNYENQGKLNYELKV